MKKPSVIVAIPAYNEEKSIPTMLDVLLKQKQDTFNLKKIVVYSDSSTDATHAIVRSYTKKDTRISLRSDKKRLGKYLRMDQMFRECACDILIVLDADIKLVGGHFLDTFVHSVINDPEAMMVQAHQIFIKPTGFIARVIFANFRIWDYVRWSIPQCNHPTNFYGSAIAFRGSFSRTIHIPTTLTDPHFFLYLMAAEEGGFRYCMDAQVLQRSIGTIADFKKFLKRTLGKPDPVLEQMFHVQTQEIYKVSLRYKIVGLLKALRFEPFYTPLGVLFNIWMQKLQANSLADHSSVWTMLESTKNTIA